MSEKDCMMVRRGQDAPMNDTRPHGFQFPHWTHRFDWEPIGSRLRRQQQRLKGMRLRRKSWYTYCIGLLRLGRLRLSLRMGGSCGGVAKEQKILGLAGNCRGGNCRGGVRYDG